jgi:cyclophilin family peptidyl-prolyl cis-trans isomerase
VESSVRRALEVATRDEAALLKDVPEGNKAQAKAALAKLKQSLQEFQVVVANKDKQEVPFKQQEALGYITAIEEAMVDGFPFNIPAPYDTLPALKGRAEAVFTFQLKEGRAGNPGVKSGTMTVVIDGYNAPVSAGSFVDLVQRGFYDGMEVQRNDGFVVQSGDPQGKETGFVDPSTGKLRNVPLEIMVKGDKVPMYGDTLEDVRRFKEDTVLPFNAFGTLAWARDEFQNDSASSQWFFLLKESELTPSGTNILDGRCVRSATVLCPWAAHACAQLRRLRIRGGRAGHPARHKGARQVGGGSSRDSLTPSAGWRHHQVGEDHAGGAEPGQRGQAGPCASDATAGGGGCARGVACVCWRPSGYEASHARATPHESVKRPPVLLSALAP